MNSVYKYARLLSELIRSEATRAIVKKIRQMSLEEEAVAFFQKVAHPPSINQWIFYSEDAQRKAICEMQHYLTGIGVEFPAPNKSVQRFLDGGEYPRKKKRLQ